MCCKNTYKIHRQLTSKSKATKTKRLERHKSRLKIGRFALLYFYLSICFAFTCQLKVFATQLKPMQLFNYEVLTLIFKNSYIKRVKTYLYCTNKLNNLVGFNCVANIFNWQVKAKQSKLIGKCKAKKLVRHKNALKNRPLCFYMPIAYVLN